MSSENRNSKINVGEDEIRVRSLELLSDEALGRRLYHAKVKAGGSGPEAKEAAKEASQITQAIERKREQRERREIHTPPRKR